MRYNTPSLEKWMSSIAAQGTIALDSDPPIQKWVDTNVHYKNKKSIFALQPIQFKNHKK